MSLHPFVIFLLSIVTWGGHHGHMRRTNVSFILDLNAKNRKLGYGIFFCVI
jgi:hypothetical protein